MGYALSHRFTKVYSDLVVPSTQLSEAGTVLLSSRARGNGSRRFLASKDRRNAIVTHMIRSAEVKIESRGEHATCSCAAEPVNRVRMSPEKPMNHRTHSSRIVVPFFRFTGAVSLPCLAVASAVICPTLVATTYHQVSAADWPNFRGPRLDGISDDKDFNPEHKTPPKKLWEKNVGSAFSSFSAVGDRLYTCGTKDKQQTLVALNADTGEIVWETPIEKEYRNEFGDGTRATPTVDGDRVYILGAFGRLLCVEAATGKVVWEKQFDHPPTWGYSASVLIEGDLAITTAGEEQGALVAFEKKTGKQMWICGKDTVGYAMPYPLTFEGKRMIAGFTGDSAILADAASGRELWQQTWETDWKVNAAMPIFANGRLFLGSGYKTGAALLSLRAEGDKVVSQQVWKNPKLLNKFQSAVLHDGHLYTSDEKAFKCIDWETGKEKWSESRTANGTVFIANAHLFLLTEGGQLRIGKVSPEAFKPLTTADILDGRCWSIPVLHRGRLYARNMERIVCLDLK